MAGGHEDFAETFSTPADLDGDGNLEIFVSNDGRWNQPNQLRLHSLVDGSLLQAFSGSDSHWGHCAEFIGDLNGDSVQDYLVGAPQANGNRGLVELRSGSDHTLIRTHLAAATAYDDRFGNTVGRLNDVNGDGIPDYVISASSEDPVGSSDHYVGSIRHYSGADGSELSLTMGNGGSHYAGRVFPGRDLDGDGGLEVVNGSAGGYFRVHDDTGMVLHEYLPSPGMARPQGRFISDHDGDGTPDLIVWGENGGRLDIVSTQTWNTLSTIVGTPSCPLNSGAGEGAGNLEVLPDLDHDGFEDIGFGSAATQLVWLISSRSGAILDVISPPAPGANFGYTVRYFSETGQLLISDTDHYVHVYELGSLVGMPYCFGDGSASACPCGNVGGIGQGCTNSTGTAGMLSAGGLPSLSADTVELIAEGLVPNSPCMFFSGRNALSNGVGVTFGDGLRCAGGEAVRIQLTAADATGSATTSVEVSTNGQSFGHVLSVGEVVRYQCWYRDFSGVCGSTYNLTNGYELIWTP
jgi:hypothetical protein